MKKIYLLLLLATFSLNLFCQQSDTIVLDSTYSYRWDTVTSDWVFYDYYLFSYDASGNQTRMIVYSESDQWGVYYSRRDYTYDANGMKQSILVIPGIQKPMTG